MALQFGGFHYGETHGAIQCPEGFSFKEDRSAWLLAVRDDDKSEWFVDVKDDAVIRLVRRAVATKDDVRRTRGKLACGLVFADDREQIKMEVTK